jgi:WD40 repeat protein
VPDERLRASLIVDKLSHDYSRFVTLELYRWEYEPMLASGSFQDAIEPPSAFDIVLLILWSRLGTPLPPKTATREYRRGDGETPVTGTEWEFEDALVAAKVKGAPAILAFRNISPAPIPTFDTDAQARSLGQLAALNDFWSRNFANRGVFLAAYDTYQSLSEFSDRLEQALRKLIEQRVKDAAARTPTSQDPVWLSAPFRGLKSYEFEHAEIFFGRDATVNKAIEALAKRARAGVSAIVISGASGSGKSSLAKAAILPRLMKPQRIDGVEFIRRCVVRPSDLGADPLLGFIQSVARTDQGADVGLPELLTLGQTPQAIAEQIRKSVDAGRFVFDAALNAVTASARNPATANAKRLLPHEKAGLVIVCDQLEELFTTADIAEPDRRLFSEVLANLANGGNIWLVATIRSDLWHRAGELPALAALSEGEGRVDVFPPSLAEITEMIRRPAAAAGLVFEQSERSGVGLDSVLAEDAAAEPGALPLLSFTLETLYTRDVIEHGDRCLTFATYESLGGLDGAIAARAEDAFKSLSPDAQSAVPKVLRALVNVSGASDEPMVARAAPLSILATPEMQAVVTAFVDARLLVASAEGGNPTIRLAHEALINRWERARERLAADRRDLETRAFLERERTRWAAADSRDQPSLLLRDFDLANALDLSARWGDELSDELRSFIAESKTTSEIAARRRRAIVTATIASLAVLTLAALSAFFVAQLQRNNALVAQSRFLARDARDATASGNATLGMLLAQAGLPANFVLADRPIVPEALYSLADAVANSRERKLMTVSKEPVWAAAFARNGRDVITAAGDGSAEIWDASTGALVRKLPRGPASIWSAAIAPDGKTAATADDAGTIRLWDIESGALFKTLTGPAAAVSSVIFSPDGSKLASASDDGTARLWLAATGQSIGQVSGAGLVESIAFSHDGTRIASGFSDGEVRVADASNGTVQLTIKAHSDMVSSVAFSPKDDVIVTASWDKTAKLWDARAGRLLSTLSGHGGRVWSAQFSADQSKVVTASEDNTARIWDAASATTLYVLQGHRDWVNTAIFSNDGSQVLTSSEDGTARLWDVNTGGAVAVLSDNTGALTGASFSPDGTEILTGSHDGTARLWNTTAEAARQVLTGHTKWVHSARFSADGQYVLTASQDKTARLWPLTANGKPVVVFSGHRDEVRDAQFSPDGRLIVTGSDDGTVKVWRVAGGPAILTIPGNHGRVWSASFSPDGSQILATSEDSHARLWNAATGGMIRTLSGHSEMVSTAAFSPDGRSIVTGSWDKTARIFDAATGEPKAVLKGHTGRISSVAFSPDGRRVVTSSDDKTARVWDASSGKTLLVLAQSDGWLHTAEYSPDGRYIVTSSEDSTARIWDAESGREITILRGHGAGVRFAAFAGDNQRVVTASADTTARIWAVPPRCGGLMRLAEQLTFRQLTPDERARYFLGARRSPFAIVGGILGFLTGGGQSCV